MQTVRRPFALTGLSLCAAFAQDTAGVGAIHGTVTAGAGRPAAGASICLLDRSRCATASSTGLFRLDGVRAGSAVLEITAPPLAPLRSGAVEVRAGLDAQVDVDLTRLDAISQSLTVRESVFVAPEEIKNSGYLIEQREISKSAGALQDVSRYVQTLPGVAIGSNDFRNDIIVRGGSPLENLFVIDNVEIPNINNFANFASAGGTVSILDAELIRDVNFLSGGFPAPFTNRLSSVLQVAQREGSRERFSGRATVGFAGAGVILEGPIRKGKGSWVTSARRSFLDYFTNDIGLGGVPVNYSFNTKALYDLGARDRIWAVNFSGVDNIRLGPTESDRKEDEELGTLDINYEGWRSASGVNWQRVFGESGVGLLGVTHSRARVNQRVKDLFRLGLTGLSLDDLIGRSPVVYREDSGEDETTFKYDLTARLGAIDKVQAGGSVKMFQVSYNAAQPFGNDFAFSSLPARNAFDLSRGFRAWQSGAYLQATRGFGSRLNFTWGGRLDNYGFISATRFSPRAGMSYRIADKVSWRASYGAYYQQPSFLFLAAFPENRGLAPMRSTHYVTGLVFLLSDTLRATVEVYRKDYRDYPVSLEFPALSLANTGDTFAVRNLLFPMTSAGLGRARGIELFIEKKFTRKWFGQTNIAYSRTRHAGLDRVFRRGSFDSPVIFNMVGGYKLNPKWEFSTRLLYLTGRPYTPFDVPASVAQRRGVFDLARINAERAPDYFRLDIRADRTFTFRGKPLLVFAGVQNATNRENFSQAIWSRQEAKSKFNDQLGLFPLIGMDWRF